MSKSKKDDKSKENSTIEKIATTKYNEPNVEITDYNSNWLSH